jgi:hypothetical protein
MLAPDPAKRFSSYDELVAELQKAQRTLTGEEEEGGERKRTSPWLIGAALLILAPIAAGIFMLTSKPAPQVAQNAIPVGPAIPMANLEKQFADARHELLIGHHKVAHAAFAHIALDAKGRQPLYDWVLLNQALAALIGREKSQARQAFQDVENAGELGFAREDADLAKFFVATAKSMSAQGVVPASGALQKRSADFEWLALLLSALKDVEQADVTDAIPLLKQFVGTQPGGKFVWIAEYKPLAQKYLDDSQLYADWKKEAKDSRNTAELSANLEKLRTVRKKLKTHSALSDELNASEKSLALRVTSQQEIETGTRDQERKKILDREGPLWNAALANYNQKMATYDFSGARDAINAAKVSEASLREAQGILEKKAQWLVVWKNKLIKDINRTHFNGVITDMTGVQYDGIDAATAQNVSMKIGPYGSAQVAWPKLPPKTLLVVSTSFIKPGAADAADRQWLSAVFAVDTGQIDTARSLADSAAKAKPEYGKNIGPLFAPTPTPH